MTITLDRPRLRDLDGVVEALRSWQEDSTPFQLHPGDLGWLWRTGTDATTAAVRTWTRDGGLVAIGILDGPDLLRLAMAPTAHRDEELAQHLAADLSAPERGVLPAGTVSLESPPGALLPELLDESGWHADEVWTPLRRDLSDPVENPGVRIETVGPADAPDWARVQKSAFGSALSLEEMVHRWHAMAEGIPYADARSLVARDSANAAVAAITVWSAGPGRCGLIEPMGVHEDHRGHGYGRAITMAAAAALRDLGSSAVLVATPSANVGAVAAYRSAGFAALPERVDRQRPPHRGSATIGA